MDIGIRELKARLSEMMDRAAAGEIIRVTERGKPKAVITPIPGHGSVDRGIEEGWIRRGNGVRRTAVSRVTGSKSIKEILDEDRGQ